MTSQGHEASTSATRPSVTRTSATRPAVVLDEAPVLTRRDLRARERATGSVSSHILSSTNANPSAPIGSSKTTGAAVAPAPGSRRALREARANQPLVPQATLEVPVLAASPAVADVAPTIPAPHDAAQHGAATHGAPHSSAPRSAAKRPSTAQTSAPQNSAPRASARATVRSRRSAAAAAPIVAPRREPSQLRGQRTRRFSVLGAMVFVGATIVSTSVPANAYFVDTPENVALKLTAAAQSGTTVGGVASVGSQEYVASGGAADVAVGRDGYSVTSLNSTVSSANAGAFTNDSTAPVQWPFATTVPISSGFGARQVANCGFCSTFHQGLDFIPGAGTPIQIIADGTVSKVEQGGGALGYNVWIEHTVNGQQVTSVYAHMLAGSIKVTQGESVKVGQLVGNVGSTGNSTGAHLHFEIHLNGVPVDPYPWLLANAGAE